MNTKSFVTATVLALLSVPAMRADIGYQFVPVGDAGNPSDPATNYGSVGYDYRIGKYEVTLSQYAAYLNAIAVTDTYGLYHSGLNSTILRSGVSGAYSYSLLASPSRPLGSVSLLDAARFANWLQNGQPTGLQTAATTEDGGYTLLGNVSTAFTRNANAKVWLPSYAEWYKAAYYDPTNDGSSYWLYPTRSDTLPDHPVGSTTDPNTANFSQTAVGILDVGSYTLAQSYYGTFDQGGNVFEAIDYSSGTPRGNFVGGVWAYDEAWLRSTATTTANVAPSAHLSNGGGFRVASSVPEPASAVLLLGGAALLGLRRRR